LTHLLARLELEGVSPAWMVTSGPQPLTSCQILELDYHSVDLVWQVVALRLDASEVLEYASDVWRRSVEFVDREPPVCQSCQYLGLRGEALGACQHVVAIDAQRPGSRQPGVLLPDGTCSHVAWVGERLFALVDEFGVDVVEGVDGQVDLAAHRQC